MKMSARLNVGQYFIDIKSMTEPAMTRSMRLPIAPPRMRLDARIEILCLRLISRYMRWMITAIRTTVIVMRRTLGSSRPKAIPGFSIFVRTR